VISEGKLVSTQFSTQSNEEHYIKHKPIQKYYVMKYISGYEPRVDEIINILIQKLNRRFVDTGEICNMDDWLFYCEKPERK
jgi:hypothetical protein